MDSAPQEHKHEILTVVETATQLRLSVGTINNWLSQGKLKRCKIGRKTFVRRAEVEQILAKAME